MTIGDIAREAGVSKGAVSYALNNKPGVSRDTRERVQQIAAQLGWTPNSAARSLSTSKADAIGLVLRRPPKMLGTEPFYMEFISGIEAALAAREIALMLQVVDTHEREVAAYRKWWTERRVDGVLVVDLSIPDVRTDAVRDIGVPAVLVCDDDAAAGLPHVWTDDRKAMLDAVRYLVRLGHRRIARVGGTPTLAHSLLRAAAFTEGLQEAGLQDQGDEITDFTGEEGARATRALLTRPDPPTAIVYDNDIMAVAGLSVASEMGIDVPRELNLLAWDDSPLCSLTHPPLSAMHRDIAELGRTAAQSLLELIDTGHTIDREGPRPVIIPRGSTASLLVDQDVTSIR
ncbi:LacI family DNA-binding transcriptional regulator [Microbacterium sp.]|uniref:LacI family DNA-binding transcriptional regulator n=1 Tax=Microbacterium sp. TaxID=51671 RepID=UPI003F70ECD1